MTLQDPFLTGYRLGYTYDTEEPGSAEGDADLLKLTGETRQVFIAGWNAGYADAERERAAFNDLYENYEEMARGYERGDPAQH